MSSSSTRPFASLLAFLLGVAGLAVAGEVGLRVAGLAMRPGISTGGEVTILCEGDSFTYGIGGLSFPNQLEDVINEAAGRKLVNAVNAGIPGLNTALLADQLDANLREHKPALVIVLAGENNSWNSVRMADPERQLPLRARVDAVLLNSRLYKFLKVAVIGWSSPRFHEAIQLDEVERTALHLIDSAEDIGLGIRELPPADETQGDLFVLEQLRQMEQRGAYDDCVALSSERLEQSPEVLAYRLNLAGCYMRLGQLAEAVELLTQIPADAAPTRELMESYFQLGFAFQRSDQFSEAVDAWFEGLSRFPASTRTFQALAHLHIERGQLWQVLDRAREIEGIEENPLFTYLNRLYDEHDGGDIKRLISQNMKADVRRIVRTAHAHGAEVILASYPYHSMSEIEAVAEELGVTYIDFRPAFNARFERREDYLSADNCHCNDAGYRLMAEVFAYEADTMLGLGVGLPNPPEYTPRGRP